MFPLHGTAFPWCAFGAMYLFLIPLSIVRDCTPSMLVELLADPDGDARWSCYDIILNVIQTRKRTSFPSEILLTTNKQINVCTTWAAIFLSSVSCDQYIYGCSLRLVRVTAMLILLMFLSDQSVVCRVSTTLGTLTGVTKKSSRNHLQLLPKEEQLNADLNDEVQSGFLLIKL